MRHEVSSGSISRAPRTASAGAKFRLALIGDFSGRAKAGRLETGAALAARKPIKVDGDKFDQGPDRQDGPHGSNQRQINNRPLGAASCPLVERIGQRLHGPR
jgi:hypothetical protein